MPAEIRPLNMTVNEFCAWARIGRTKAYELMNSGEIKSFKIGRSTLIPHQAAEDWLAAQPLYRPLRERTLATSLRKVA